MVFSSGIFLLVFLPAVFLLNLLMARIHLTASNLFLLLASLFFYAWGEPILVLVMIASILINYAAGRLISHFRGTPRKVILFLGVVCNLGILGYYKYAGFLATLLNDLLHREVLSVPQITLPIGISFFTFQAISYIADVYKGETDASPRLVNTALYISFFPQLIAGPIVKYRDIDQQIRNRSITTDRVAEGFRKFIYGLAKKVLLANVLGLCADRIFALDVAIIGGKTAWVGALAYAFQIYYDFSGYSDMAIGLGRMFGFDILPNFNYPYLSASIREFWRRWHISLGSWFREYVYIPLGGNRKGTLRTYLHLTVVFFLTGLWHGANVTFILWGLYHGFFSILERLGLSHLLKKIRPLDRIYCFLTVTIGWVLFRSDTTEYAVKYIVHMLLPWRYSDAGVSVWTYFDYKTLFTAICAVLGMGLLPVFVKKSLAEKWTRSTAEALYCLVLLILCLASVAGSTYNPFIYFQF